jgi:hypothetical protein
MSGKATVPVRHKGNSQLGVKGKTLNELISEGWTWPSFEGVQRPDGIEWSELEAPCEPS